MPPRTVPCPRCRAPALFAPENPYRPFCSERCRLGDMAAWASDEYCIPAGNEPAMPDADPDESESF